ncbi:MAG: hypothetical protein GF384_05885 [Elusimicrobia bacterium]|nr:hypothetical protein [Elusimicrobiota bacterium]
MALINGAFIKTKYNQYQVFLTMAKPGGKAYEQLYGTYIKETDALTICHRMNHINHCSQCKHPHLCNFKKTLHRKNTIQQERLEQHRMRWR